MPPKPLKKAALFILIINITIFPTSILLHELGHVVFSTECKNARIVVGAPTDEFSLGIPIGAYTEMECPENTNKTYLGLTGFPFLIIAALALLILKIPERSLGYIILGISVMLAGLDMLLVINTPLTIPIMSLAGISIIMLGEIKLINNYIPYGT
jgi:hypothetical protein